MLNSIIGTEITLSAFFLCTAVSLVLGVGVALVGTFRAHSSQSYALTLAVLPAAVQVVIMLVNGNIGAGVAVAGAFSLVRFRSAPGRAGRSAPSFWPWPSGWPPAWDTLPWRSFSSLFSPV